MNKRARHFERIAEYRERFSSTPTETLVKRHRFGSLIKEAQIAIREILEERNEVHLIRAAASTHAEQSAAEADRGGGILHLRSSVAHAPPRPLNGNPFMPKSAYQRLRRRAYVRRERRGMMSGCSLIGVPIFLGALASGGVFVVFGILNLLLPWFIWLPAEKRAPATFGEFLGTVGFCTAFAVGFYYVAWVFFFVLAPDVRHLGNKERRNQRRS